MHLKKFTSRSLDLEATATGEGMKLSVNTADYAASSVPLSSLILTNEGLIGFVFLSRDSRERRREIERD